MATIKYIKDKDDNLVLPVTAPKAVIDEQGVNLETTLTNIKDKDGAQDERLSEVEENKAEKATTYTKEEVDSKIFTERTALNNETARAAAAEAVLQSGVTQNATAIAEHTQTLNDLQDAVDVLDGNSVIVVEDHTDIDTDDPSFDANKIYREPEDATDPTYYIDWMWDGTTWKKIKKSDTPVENVPTKNSNNIVKSGGIFNAIQNEAIFDISVKNAVGGTPYKYADLADALGTNGGNIPADYRHGGMSVRFIRGAEATFTVVRVDDTTELPNPSYEISAQSIVDSGTYTASNLADFSDVEALPTTIGNSKVYYYQTGGTVALPVYSVWTITKLTDAVADHYEQYRLMNAEWSINLADWQGVDDEPTAGSENLAKSGGVINYVQKVEGISVFEKVVSTTGENLQWLGTINVKNTNPINVIVKRIGGTASFNDNSIFSIWCDGSNYTMSYNSEEQYWYSSLNKTVNEITLYVRKGTISSDGTIEVSVLTDNAYAELQEIKNIYNNINSLYAENGYYECSTNGNTATKVVSAPGFILHIGGSVKIKMAYRNTVANANLNINSSGTKPLYYGKVRAGISNTWKDNEILEVYYDGTNYYANSVQDGVFVTGERTENLGVAVKVSASVNRLVGNTAVFKEINFFTPITPSSHLDNYLYGPQIIGQPPRFGTGNSGSDKYGPYSEIKNILFTVKAGGEYGFVLVDNSGNVVEATRSSVYSENTVCGWEIPVGYYILLSTKNAQDVVTSSVSVKDSVALLNQSVSDIEDDLFLPSEEDITSEHGDEIEGYIKHNMQIGANISSYFGSFGSHYVFDIPADKSVRITIDNTGLYGFAITDSTGVILEFTTTSVASYNFAKYSIPTKLYVSTSKIINVFLTSYNKKLKEQIEQNTEDIEQNTEDIEELKAGIGISNFWKGKTLWWCGTSIPAGSDETIPGADETVAGNYPTEVGNDLGCTVINKAVGGSMCRANVRTGDYVGANISNITSALSMTKEEIEYFISNYSTIKDVLVGNPPAELSQSQITRLRAASFEDRLLPYLDGTYDMPDLFVIDHGHNDFKYKLSNNTSDIGLEPTVANIGGELTEDTYMTANNNAKLESFFGSLANIPSARKAEFIASVNRNCYIGAVNFIVTLILKYNPHARIIFISNYEYEDGASPVYAPIISAQESIAKSWAFPLCEVYKYLGYSNHLIPGSMSWFNSTYPAQTAATTDITVYKAYLADGVHPHSDITGDANNIYAGIISEFIKRIR